MDTNQIISQIDTEIARLQQVKSILSGTTSTPVKRAYKKSGIAPTPINAGKRILSAEARAKISAAQKVRWAKFKKAKRAA